MAAEMSPGKIIDIVTRLENNYPVDEWTVRGIHVWPLIRIPLSYDLHYAGIGAQEADSLTVSPTRIARLLKLLKIVVGDKLLDFQKNQLGHPNAEAAFLTNNQCRTKIGDLWADRLCDPLVGDIKENGKECLILEKTISSLSRVPRRYPSKLIQLNLLKARIEAKLSSTRRQNDPFNLPEYQDFLAEVRDLDHQIHTPTLDRLLVFTDTLLRVASFFKKQLYRSKVKIGFVVAFYGLDGMAFCQACWDLGIPVADLQHGIISEYNHEYTPWTKIPAGGYGLLPSIFWCWSEEAARAIKLWSDKTNGRYQAFVGKNLWMRDWITGHQELTASCDEQILDRIGRRKKSTNIILALQPLQQPIAEWVVKALKNAPDDWNWWPRIHPIGHHTIPQIKAMFERVVPGRHHVDLATQLPLPALLRHMDALITDYSSSLMEAESMGVPAVITHPAGRELFADQIKAGRARFVQTESELLETIGKAESWRENLPQNSDNMIFQGSSWYESLMAMANGN